jgi:hypothetical protein
MLKFFLKLRVNAEQVCKGAAGRHVELKLGKICGNMIIFMILFATQCQGPEIEPAGQGIASGGGPRVQACAIGNHKRKTFHDLSPFMRGNYTTRVGKLIVKQFEQTAKQVGKKHAGVHQIDFLQSFIF